MTNPPGPDRKRIVGIMKIEIFPDADAVANAAAKLIAGEARAAVSTRGRFVLAVSGGRTPWTTLRALAGEDLPWKALQIVQVDERAAPAGHADRNLTHLHACLLGCAPISPDRIRAMPVEEPDPEAAAERYVRILEEIAGAPPVLDLVQLGLGSDGHTASLVPGDPSLEVTASDVAGTGIYNSRRRMTMTFPILNRARRILWIVTGREKADMLARLRAGDRSIPAGRVRPEHALILADRQAAGG
jgi:6-phosphogluconolactonase